MAIRLRAFHRTSCSAPDRGRQARPAWVHHPAARARTRPREKPRAEEGGSLQTLNPHQFSGGREGGVLGGGRRSVRGPACALRPSTPAVSTETRHPSGRSWTPHALLAAPRRSGGPWLRRQSRSSLVCRHLDLCAARRHARCRAHRPPGRGPAARGLQRLSRRQACSPPAPGHFASPADAGAPTPTPPRASLGFPA